MSITGLLGLVATAMPAAADDETVTDATGDVRTIESGAAVNEPRIDITQIDVTHESRLLEITATVAQFTPLDDPAWEDGNLFLQVVLTDGADGFWLWNLFPDPDGGAIGSLLSFDTFTECVTSASADADARQYRLTAEAGCLRDVPRAVQVGVAMAYDASPLDDDFDVAGDQAPDDEFTAPVGSSGPPAISRLAGSDRIETAIALSVDQFPNGGATAAVLASSADFPDAIAGGPLAVANGGPLLLTAGDALDPRVIGELERAVEPGGQVFLLGGTAVLGEPVATSLRELGYRPKRVAGATRFETAVAIADEIGGHALVLVADGRSFLDGLIAGAAASSSGGVVVLTDGASLPKPTDDYLSNDSTRHLAIGTAAAASPGAERITASSAAELSQKVLDRLLPDVGMIAVAGTGTFADALTGAPHLASLGGGLLLTDGGTLSPATKAELTQRRGELREVVLYGGTAALSTAVADAVTAAVS